LIKKGVITAAGLGTRLLSVTKAQPKEMLPVFARCKDGGVCMKPIVQLVFEDLYNMGIRDFCFVVGRGQRIIREHFTPDSSYLFILDKRGKNGLAKELEAFYEMVSRSSIEWVNQPEPRGFGDAVMRTEAFVGGESFLLHAGDNFFVSKNRDHLKRLLDAANSLHANVVFLVQEVKNPGCYGVVEAISETNGLVHVKRVVEKPESPPSNLAIMPAYVLKPAIFAALRETRPGYGGELQLTDGIQKIIESGKDVYGIDVNSDAVRLDVGSPELYMDAQAQSYKRAVEERSSIDQDQSYNSPIPKTL
jgi:UTP--glucose-1-phosphate uridylyltransferase